jgi:hypothetical protein
MLRRILFIGGAFLGVALMVSPALGQRNPPKKAKKYSIEVVQGMSVCTAANTTAPGLLATAACDPPVPADPGCVFGLKGKGKVSAKSATGDIAIQAKLTGLDLACVGESLCAVSGVRTTVNGCASTGSCSTVTQVDLPLGGACCTVDAKGKCAIKTTVNSVLPGAITTGNVSEFTLGEVGLLRTGVPLNPPNTRQPTAFRGGILVL